MNVMLFKTIAYALWYTQNRTNDNWYSSNIQGSSKLNKVWNYKKKEYCIYRYTIL